MFRLKYGLAAMAVVIVAGLSGCSADRNHTDDTPDPAAVEATATPATTPANSLTPAPTPDDRSRAERLAENQRRVRELIRQNKLEEAAKNSTQPPGTETQYN